MFISFKKTKRGELVLQIDKTVFTRMVNQSVQSLSLFFEFLLQFRLIAIAGFGLGLGISMSAVILQTPPGVSAKPQVYASEVGVMPLQMKIQDSDNLFDIHQLDQWNPKQWKFSQSVWYLNSSAKLSEVGPIVLFVGTRQSALADFQKLELGSTLSVIGENNGIYQYTVIGIQGFPAEEIPTLFTQTSETLVVIVPGNFWSNDFRAIIAK
mgnify:CR=1 FL=1